MTSPDATGFMPRAHNGAGPGRTLGDWATLLTFGPVNAPWLLRSLRGGSKASKRALLDRLGLPRDALPNLGSWKADVGLLELVSRHILEERPKIVVEFGAGASSLIIARALQLSGGGTLISFDQHGDFVEATREWLGRYGLEADLRAVPLAAAIEGWRGMWYDHGPLPDAIDLLLIDGPPWTIHPLTRGSAESLFNRISPDGVVMLDDGARPGERLVARRWTRQWPQFDFRLVHGGTKGTLIGHRRF